MDNELNVKLGLDTSAYEDSIENSLNIFNGFQKSLSSAKVGFNTAQIKEASKVFSDIRKTALGEINKITKRMDSIDNSKMKIEADISGAKAKLEELAKVEESSYGKARKEIVNQMEKLKNSIPKMEIKLSAGAIEMDSLTKEYFQLHDDLKSNPLEFDLESSSLKKFNTEVDNIKQGLDRTGVELDEAEKKTNKLARAGNRLNLMGRIFSQIKNSIAMALNPMNWFRRAWQEVVMQDGSRIGDSFKMVGQNILNFVAPAIIQIAKWILTALGYLNIFLKALTGGKLDLFNKSAKSSAEMYGNTKKTAKETKEIAKSLAGFDEINDIGDSGGGGSDAGGLAGGPDFSKAFDPMENLDMDWVKKIEGFGKWLGENWKWIVAAIAAIGLAFLGWKIFGKTAKGVGELGGTFKGFFDGLGKAAQAIAILGGIALVIGQLTGLIKAFSESGLSLTDMGILLVEVFGAIALGFVAIAASTKLMDWSGIAAAVVILGGFALILNQVSKLLKTFADTGMSVGEVVGLMAAIFVPLIAMMAAVAILGPMMVAGLIPFAVVIGLIMAFLAVLAITLPPILDAVGKFFQTVGPIMVQILDKVYLIICRILDTVDTLINNLLVPILVPLFHNIGGFIKDLIEGIKTLTGRIGDFFNSVKSKIVDVFTKGGEIFKGIADGISNVVKTVVNAIISGANVVIAMPFNTINGLLNIVRNVSFLDIEPFKGLWKQNPLPVPQIPKLATGTEFVPNDMLAVIHQGEAVVPKKFNDKSYFGNTDNNAETNSLLKELIDRVENIEVNPYTTIKDVGSTAVKYIKDSSRQLGKPVI